MTDNHKPDIMTPKQVAEMTGIPEGTLRYFRSVGIGPASFRLQGRVRYRRIHVEAWIAEQEAATLRGGVAR